MAHHCGAGDRRRSNPAGRMVHAARLPAPEGAHTARPFAGSARGGYHTIQSTIAVGSGGVAGKGWLSGSQTHLDFIPERTTDFIFAVYSEEFGLIGNGILLVLFLLVIARGAAIAAGGPGPFPRVLGGAITLTFFTYAFVNMGMVSGILPVVGVPLPLISYGGTSLVTICLGF